MLMYWFLNIFFFFYRLKITLNQLSQLQIMQHAEVFQPTKLVNPATKQIAIFADLDCFVNIGFASNRGLNILAV